MVGRKQVSGSLVHAEAIVEAMDESVLVTTTNLSHPGPYIVYANPAFERMTGWRLSEIEGRSPRLLQGEKTDHRILAHMPTTIRNGDKWTGQTVNYRKDGTPFWMEWSVVPLSDDAGRHQFYLAVQRDVTERVQATERLAAAQRSEQLAEQVRHNLSRYFSPSTVDYLAQKDTPFAPGRRQTVTVLFADIIGFAAIAESTRPENVIEFLRTFHQRLEAIIFACGGSVEDIVGDEIMAVFGAPNATPNDAANAIKCAIKILSDVDDWNIQNKQQGKELIGIGVGLHYGPAVMGDIGSERRMSFSVVGDTVNTASRLERMTRDFGVKLALSDAVVQAALQGEPCHKTRMLLDKLEDQGEQTVRGRQQKLRVWTL